MNTVDFTQPSRNRLSPGHSGHCRSEAAFPVYRTRPAISIRPKMADHLQRTSGVLPMFTYRVVCMTADAMASTCQDRCAGWQAGPVQRPPTRFCGPCGDVVRQPGAGGLCNLGACRLDPFFLVALCVVHQVVAHAAVEAAGLEASAGTGEVAGVGGVQPSKAMRSWSRSMRPMRDVTTLA